MKINGNKHSPQPAAKQPRASRPRWQAGLIVALAVVAVLMAGAVAGLTYVRGVNTIFPRVRVDGIDLGGQSLEQAMETLRSHGYESLGDAAVTVELPMDLRLTVRADEVCSETPVAEIAQMAFDRCKGGSAVKNAMTYLRCRLGGLELESESALRVDQAAVRAKVDAAALELRGLLLDSSLKIGEDSVSLVKGASDITVDTAGLSDQIVRAFEDHNYDTIHYEAEIHSDGALDLQRLYDSVYAEAADAYYSENYQVEPEVVGVRFDLSEAQRLWDAADYGEQVVIPLILTQPEITAEQLEALLFRDRLSTMSTSLWGSSSNRINNVKRASESINGIILLPGESFSYNEALGQRTAANGYLPAGAYSNGEVVQEYGGGICQVSSTLYYCCLYANLKITSRSCHYFPVGYLPAGLDATVSWGGPEYQFVNNRDYPIKIVATVDETAKTSTVELWGTDTDGSYVEMKYSTALVYDQKYTDVAVGYKARTVRNVYAADGTLLSSRQEANSYYHYHDEDIKWPEEPAETEPPQPSETPAPPEETVPPEETTPPEETAPPEESAPPEIPTDPEDPETPPAPEDPEAPPHPESPV